MEKHYQEAVVSVKGVSKWYQQGALKTTALDHVSLDVERGAFLALCGPSGSGKTTLLNVMGALDTPSTGQIFIAGHPLHDLSKKELALLRRDRIGFVFQAFNLIPVYTALENAAFTLSLRKVPRHECLDRARQALKDVGLEGMEKRFPRELSGGQQQRVAVARAVAGEPDLILADEPTASLDSKTAYALLDMMQGLNQKKQVTFVFSTHDERIMNRATSTVWLKDGTFSTEPKDEP